MKEPHRLIISHHIRRWTSVTGEFLNHLACQAYTALDADLIPLCPDLALRALAWGGLAWGSYDLFSSTASWEGGEANRWNLQSTPETMG
jgi:hypothetical protein